MSYVGVFWFVPANLGGYSALVADMAPIEAVPASGGVKRHPRSHSEHWSDLAQLGVRGLRSIGHPNVIAEADWQTYPRGHVEFEVGCRRSILRVDARLQRQEFIGSVVAHFDILPGHLTVFTRPSYVSVGPLDPPKPWD